MTNGEGHDDPRSRDEILLARARTATYARMALVSAVIWTLGTLVMFILIVPAVARPQPYILVASLVPLVPASLPWLFYGRISRAVARRMARAEQREPPDGGDA